jgi:transcriptional regulator with XRE-family HTH domain
MSALHPLMKFRLDQRPPMTQAELARRLGVSRSCINRIEGGTRQIGIELLPKAAKETGLPPAVLRPDLRAVLKRGSIRKLEERKK